jgi:hypothetical protein
MFTSANLPSLEKLCSVVNDVGFMSHSYVSNEIRKAEKLLEELDQTDCTLEHKHNEEDTLVLSGYLDGEYLFIDIKWDGESQPEVVRCGIHREVYC